MPPMLFRDPVPQRFPTPHESPELADSQPLRTYSTRTTTRRVDLLGTHQQRNCGPTEPIGAYREKPCSPHPTENSHSRPNCPCEPISCACLDRRLDDLDSIARVSVRHCPSVSPIISSPIQWHQRHL